MVRYFKKNDIIEFAGDLFLVLENYGNSGKVQEIGGGDIINPFYWYFDGEEAILHSEERSFLP